MRVRDAMTCSVTSFSGCDSLLRIMEALSAHRFTAVLIRDAGGAPAGVISKTDLVLAYMRGVAPDTEVKTILRSSRVISCDESTFLEVAIQRMLLSDRQRLFVHKTDPRHIVGVFSISDAARARSGSCQACMSSRIIAAHES
jgi:CBS domain-containing protein